MYIKRVTGMICLSLLASSAVVLSACAGRETPEIIAAESDFLIENGTLMGSEFSKDTISFFATNTNGETLEGIRSETDGTYYLFIPSTQEVSDLVVHYTGEVIDVSAGKLNEDKSIIVNAFGENGDKIKVTEEDGTVVTVAVMQSDLPAVQIYLNDTTLETVHQDKEKKYKGNTFILTEPSGEYDLTVEDSVELKGRGNSTWTFWDKKGYQVKFEDKTSVLGMGKAKKWVLLPNAADDSMMRSQLVFRMAENLEMAFVPSFEYVDLWINGDYRGTYLLGEKAEIGSSRLDLEQPDGAMFEHDVGFYEEEEYWFYSDTMKKQFTLKEIVEEEPAIMEQAMDCFHIRVDELMSWLYSTPSEKITLEQLSDRIDVDSFAKYYLINEYVLNRESFESSFYWYQDGSDDVLHLGPIWDFDTCMGNDGTDVTDRYGYNHTLFASLLEIPEFQARTEELYEQYKDVFESMIADADVLKEKIANSAEMNYFRWALLGKPNPKEPMLDHHDTFDEAVSALQEWLRGRKDNFMIGDYPGVFGKTNDDCSELKLCFNDHLNHEKVQFAVWNRENRKRLLLRTDAELVDGMWQGSIDLTMFNASGLYQIDVYIDEDTTVAATGRTYVEKAAEQIYQLDAEIIKDGKKLQLILENQKPCENVTFTVWSEVNSQDDLQRFEAKQNRQGVWERTVNMKKFQDEGLYYIHAYGDVNGISELLNVEVIEIKFVETAKE